MTAISQAKQIVVAKYDAMTGSQNAAGAPVHDAGARIERIIKTIASSNLLRLAFL